MEKVKFRRVDDLLDHYLVGRSLLPEPYSKFLENNQMPVLGACFMCNLVAGNLLNTGAFEVSQLHDVPNARGSLTGARRARKDACDAFVRARSTCVADSTLLTTHCVADLI